MAERERPQRITIGFIGGQALAARVLPDELTKLRNALGSTGWHDVAAEDGTIAIDLEKVAYVIAEHEEHRVGFGT
ncbi:MAG: hypothetical protein JO321_12625 [Solirubrobacterales bacterium]|nr:hypothetical protein [Solirubrobacterales bacterium]MBV9164785.1 hypothetical protein [Solirubrobacterales bacterium]MBV9536248.1 hypothetical protein [Solirubrobacterales bacterium]